MNKGMTKREMVEIIFGDCKDDITYYEERKIMMVSKERIEYAYNVYKSLLKEMPDMVGLHYRLIKGYLLRGE